MDTLKSMTDEELAFAYINGNNRAFDELLSRTQDKLFNYIMYVVKDEDLANDLFQEAFLKVITKMQHGRYYRDIKSSKTVEPSKNNDLTKLSCSSMLETNRENQMSNEQVIKDLKRLVEALPEVQREVVHMRYFQELSFKEIAERTNVSINTSLGRMRYALINLRKLTREHNVDLTIEP